MSEHAATERDVIEQLADSFVARFRRGERPSVDEYAQRYPDLADQLRELLPALVLLEQNAAYDDTDISGCARTTTAAPAQIGEFSIVREIGRGGMGVVYEAVQQSLGRHVALKVLSTPRILNPTHLERFEAEARAAARLHHTHIVPVFGVGEHEGIHFYAMQFIQGQSLDLVIEEIRRLRRILRGEGSTMAGGYELTHAVTDGLLTGHFRTAGNGGIEAVSEAPHIGSRFDSESHVVPIGSSACSGTRVLSQADFTSSRSGREFYRSVARVGMQVADALAYAHTEGILHRDIKPSNLLLDIKGNVWITDFGLAKSEDSDGLTRTGDFVGTLRYMAPERLEGRSDRRSDLYSLGATLYELVTLKPFLESASRGQLVDRILHESPPPPSKFDAAIPCDLETILLKATAKEPDGRYHTAADMADDLRRFLADRPIEARRSTSLERFVRWCRRNPLVASLAGALAALLVAAIVILAVSNAQIRREVEAKTAALDEKEAALSTAREAVDQMLTRTASDVFADVPRLHPLRLALIEDALRLYEALAAESQADPMLRHEMAMAFQAKASLEREMGLYPAAVASLRTSIELQRKTLDADPSLPNLLERLAASEQELALSLYFSTNPPVATPEVIAQYHRAVQLFDELDRKRPDHPQPAVHCRRYLAHFVGLEGDQESAQRILRDTIARGEAYCTQHPEDRNERQELGWACTNLFDSLTDFGQKPHDEAESILAGGLGPIQAQLREQPELMSARDVTAALEIRLAFHHCAAGDVDKGLSHFRTAVQTMESLCEEFPQNSDFWGNIRWFHDDMCTRLRDAGHADDARAALLRCRDWLRDVQRRSPDEPAVKKACSQLEADVSQLLRSAGQPQER